MRRSNDPVSRRDALGHIGALFMVAALPIDWRWSDDTFPHPEPRVGISAAAVLPDDRLPNKKRVRALYSAAREYPEIFDGVYCTCHCAEDGHRSLLSCFESEQATGCWGCQELADEVIEQARAGKTLKEIRAHVDGKFAKAARKNH